MMRCIQFVAFVLVIIVCGCTEGSDTTARLTGAGSLQVTGGTASSVSAASQTELAGFRIDVPAASVTTGQNISMNFDVAATAAATQANLRRASPTIDINVTNQTAVVGPITVRIPVTLVSGESNTDLEVYKDSGSGTSVVDLSGQISSRTNTFVEIAVTSFSRFWASVRQPVVNPLTVTSILPNAGPLAGGTPFTLTGTGYSSGTIGVRFGTSDATNVQIVSDTQLAGLTPAATAPGAVNVVVTRGSDNATLTNGYTYSANTVDVTSISPTTGPETGGTTITITGTGFQVTGATVNVAVGLALATSVTVISNTEITCVTPAGTGVQGVTVTLLNGTSVVGLDTLANAFTYTAGASAGVRPNSFTVAPGLSGLDLLNALAGTYSMVCWSSGDTGTHPVGDGLFVIEAGGTMSLRASDNTVRASYTWDGGAADVGTQVGAGATLQIFDNGETINAFVDFSNGTIDASHGSARYDNRYKTVGASPVPALMASLAGTYQLTSIVGAQTLNLTIDTNGNVTYDVDGGTPVNIAWDGNHDYIRPNGALAVSTPESTDLRTLLYSDSTNGTESGDYQIRIDVDPRLDTAKVSQAQIGIGFTVFDFQNAAESIGPDVGGLPDVFDRFAGRSFTARVTGVTELGGGAASPPATYTDGGEVTFTINANGTIDFGGAFSLDRNNTNIAQVYNGDGNATLGLSLDHPSGWQATFQVDTDYADAWEVRLVALQFTTTALQFTLYSCDRTFK